jgi:hypothetical protein
MAKFRRKPIVLEAEQWRRGTWMPDVITDPKALVGDRRFHLGHQRELEDGYGVILTLEGPMFVSDGDWIVTGVNGEKWPVKPDIFEATYEPVAS